MAEEAAKAEYCGECKRIVGIGCACGLTFAEKMKTIQVDRFGLLDRDRKAVDPKNRGTGRKLK